MALVAVLLTAAVIAIVISIVGVAGQRDEIGSQTAAARRARLAVNGLMQASIDAETGQRGYLLTGDRAFLEPYDSGRTRALQALANLRASVDAYPQLHQNVSRADALAQRAFIELAAPLERRLSRQELRQALTTSKSTMNELRAEARALLAGIESILESSQRAEQHSTARLYWLGATLALLALIAVAVTVLALYKERQSWRDTFSALTAAREAAEHARERAAASDLAKSRFLAVASHDMRQPLHALSLYLSALDRRVENPEARGILAKMERATDSMIAMFSALLDLARIQAGTVAPEIADFPLQDIFDRLAAESHDAKIEVEQTALYLCSDRVLIERALRNLVANALKHGGGTARLSARALDGRAEIVVADRGPGISPDDQARIFDEFVRLDLRTEGLGLGLAIVRGIAQALDIPLEVRSRPGEGAHFILRPKLSKRAEQPAALRDEAIHLAGALALVVDDEQLAREAVARSLADLGAQVRMAANEAEAQRVLDEGFAPSLVLMDLRIDGELRGVEIARRIHARLSAKPRVIIVTGDTAADTLSMLQASGFAWLIKPVDPRELSQLSTQRS